MLAILAIIFVYNLQKTKDTLPTSGLFALFAYLFVDRKISTIWFQFPIFYSTP